MKRVTPLPSKPQHGAQTYRRLLIYARPHIAIFGVAVLGFLLFSVMGVSLIAVTELLLDAVGAGISEKRGFLSKFVASHYPGGVMPQETARWLVPLAMLLIIVLRALGNFIGSYGLAYVARAVIHQLRTELFEKIGQLPSAYFDRYTGAYLISKVSYNVEQVTNAITKAIKVLFRESFTTLGLLIYLLLVNWKLTLTFFLFAPLIAFIVRVVGKRFRKLSHRIQNSMGDVTHVTQEAINGYQVVRMYGGQAYERSRFLSASDNNRRQFMKLVVTNTASVSVIQILVGLSTATIVWLALAPGMVESMTAGVFAAYIGAAASLAKPVRSLSEVFADIQKGIAAAESIFEVMDAPKEPQGGNQRLSRPVRGAVSFDALEFSYDEAAPKVLERISFSVGAGETVALVGASGSGKSTLVSLLARFYEPSGGRILVDGTDISTVPVTELRRHISMVSQNIVLFNDTVYRNIAYGELENAPRKNVLRAIEQAHAAQFIEALPQGLETALGDNAQTLSGGQRQRLSIARALLKDAPILILDEATSALDNESESHIQAALKEVMKNRTTFVIAHRLSTIENADRILVMERGRIVESGDHSELLARGGHYAVLLQRQTMG
ncbi:MULTISPECIES: lipid A export permease/ATP-binding protein MsbA [unclassified Microbulbifer]|uniref:Lipid A export permease/ATP-binding protein MsbA n=1 Tax=Microbulbifer spongiae TaxID=2944933 RepID=A0ABY9EE91_9GAMM|nr:MULTISPECIES: lipid A export permease/ATP-binding protein MsbA [unclassified Microbulbifer]MDP5208677.1 lipid A export permease/ATP-binding protein MsbA [Microbulbifer sp. 2205BS26-8]WKD51343.1 lipid A export permease/ATP-binding protein MsbA [Microbulbifer sp. MI-G]